MNDDIRNNELVRASHLMILISYTIFSVILIAESFVLSWEGWATILVIVGILSAWFLHIRQNLGENTRLWIYSLLMMVTYFYYGTHQTSTFDICAVMLAVITLYTMTGIQSLIGLCQFTFFITFAFDLISMISEGEFFDSLVITRSMLHAGLIIMVGWVARTIIDRWENVLGTSRKEIGELRELTRRLNDLVMQIRRMKPAELELVINVDPKLPSVMRTDVGKLKKILWHLITNGLKYTRDYLARARQVSGRVAKLSQAFMIRPVLLLRDGRMKVGKVFLGSRERAWRNYIASSFRAKDAIDKSILFVTYAGLSQGELD